MSDEKPKSAEESESLAIVLHERVEAAKTRPILQPELDDAIRVIGHILGLRVIRRYPVGHEPMLVLVPKQDGSFIVELLKDTITELNLQRDMVLGLGDWLGQQWDPEGRKWIDKEPISGSEGAVDVQ